MTPDSLSTGTPQWAEGDRIYRGRETLEVVAVIAAEPEDDVAAYLVVKAA